MSRSACFVLVLLFLTTALVMRYGFGIDAELWFEQKGWTLFFIGVAYGIYLTMPGVER